MRWLPGSAAGATLGSTLTNSSARSVAHTPHCRLRTFSQRGPGSSGSGRFATRAALRGDQATPGQAGPMSLVASILGKFFSTKIVRMTPFSLPKGGAHRLNPLEECWGLWFPNALAGYAHYFWSP